MKARAWGGYLRRPRHVFELISSLAERSGVQSDISDDRKVPSIVAHWHAHAKLPRELNLLEAGGRAGSLRPFMPLCLACTVCVDHLGCAGCLVVNCTGAHPLATMAAFHAKIPTSRTPLDRT